MFEIVPFEKLITPDPTNFAFGWHIDTDGLQELLRACEVVSTVPEEVRKQLEVAKKLFVYGYFVYPFYTLAVFTSIVTVESALIHRFAHYYNSNFRLTKKTEHRIVSSYEAVRALLRKGWKLDDAPEFRGGLKALLQWAAGKNLVHDARRFIELLPRIRGTFAHPLFQTVMTIGMAQPVLETIVELVNELFGS